MADADTITILEKSFVSITRLSQQAVRLLDRWYSRQNILIKMEICTEQRNQFFKYSKQFENKSLVSLIAFYMAIRLYHEQMILCVNKNKSMNLKGMDKTSELAIKQFKKAKVKVKREKLINLWSIIQKLKTEGFSFREISNFLKSKHRFNVSHTYISNVWKELEDDC